MSAMFQPLVRINRSGSGPGRAQARSAGFQACRVADFRVGGPSAILSGRRLGNLRYGRLGSLRYIGCDELSWLALLAAAALLALPVYANPVGGTVVQGTASITSQGAQLTVQQTSANAQINWSSFNIGVGETTTFVQPSSSSLVWNQIHDTSPSQILGNLNANGYVVLQNSSGFYIGGQAAITAHGILMTTAPIPVPDLSSGGAWQFNAPPPTASIINYGQIGQATGDKGGTVFLIAADIQNHGTISAPQGNVGLYAGQQVLVSARPDGRGLSAKVTLPHGSVDNQGQVIADAGTIQMQAQVVNQGGLVQANSMSQANGVIELIASDSLTLGASSTISAHGDSTSASPSEGGFVVVKSDKTFNDSATSTIDVSGRNGGRDGVVEILGSGVTPAGIQSRVNGQSAAGYLAAGGLLLTFDPSLSTPKDLTLSSDPSAPAADTPNLSLDDLASFSKIDLFAAGNININSSWGLSASQDPLATLRLSAGNSITLAADTAISAPANWSVNLSAGPQNLTSKPAFGSGRADGIYLDGNSFIQSQDGAITVWAANEVLINTGDSGAVGNNGIRTLGGGSITVSAQYGNVNTGANPQGFYRYNRTTPPYYTVSSTLGGISTKAGGDVTIDAGGDVISYLPNSSLTGPNALADGGSGAFGSKPGNVTINAGGNVFGHYVVANGVGTINAGQNIGAASASQNVALSLISGSWTLNAANGSIYLQEVRNPNGVFNGLGSPDSRSYHLFDYDPLASLNLNAANDVYLTGLSLLRPNDPVPIVLPPILSINAGRVVLQTSMSLFPSLYQSLDIHTTGDLVGAPIDPTAPSPELIMSDSPSKQWLGSTSFGDTDHSSTPLEVNNPNPAVINVGGNMQNVIFIADRQARITVGGDMINCGFAGENLHAGDVTSIDVTGNIRNEAIYNFVILNQAIQAVPATDLPPGTASIWNTLLSLALDPAKLASAQVPANLTPSQLAAYAFSVAPIGVSFDALTYNPTTRRLGYLGQMSPDLLVKLTQPLTVLRYGPDGFPVVDATHHFVTDHVAWADPAAIQTLFTETQGAGAEAGLGYRLGGPGVFDIRANSISLGNTYGILSCGVSDVTGGTFGYGALASLPRADLNPPGATLNVTVQKDNPDTGAASLDMLTSTIASLGGGDVNVTSVGGSMNLGSQEVLLSGVRQVAFGIFSSGRGNVNVTALGDIDVAGSRIGSFNGGNITVESLQGSVNAGSGGTMFVQVPSSYIDPVTGLAGTYTEEVFGSGIVANTLVNGSTIPGSAALPGNITVQTPRGNIYASQGGILQEALNGNLSAGPTVTLVAGSQGYPGNIDLGDSGVIGGTINATANGNITGLVISRQNSTINAAQSFSGIVLSGGTANLSAGGSISGTIIGVGGINASGGQGVSATLLSQNVTVGAAQAQSTLGTSASATAASQSAAQQANTEAQQQVASNNAEEDDKKKNAKPPTLVRRVGRVTVILPPGS